MGPLGAQRCPVCGALLPRGTLAAAAHVEGCLGGGGTCPGPSVQRQQASLGRFFGSLAKQKVQGPAPEGAGGGGARKRGRETSGKESTGPGAPSREPWKGVQSFEKVLQYGATLPHLLAEDVTGMRRYRLCSPDSKNLLLRLYLRKGPWFRTQKLQYAEVGSIDAAVKELREAGLMELAAGSKDDCEGVLKLGTLDELRSLATRAFGKGRKLNGFKKDRLVAEILTLWDRPKDPFSKYHDSKKDCGGGDGSRAVLGLLSSYLGPAVRISDSCSRFLRLLCLIYFLDDSQGIETLVASEANAFTYPEYEIGLPGEIFRDRDSLLSYDRALIRHREAWEAAEADDGAALVGAVLEACEVLQIPAPENLFREGWLSGSESAESEYLRKAIEEGVCARRPFSSLSSERPALVFLRRYDASWPSAKTVGIGVKFLESRQSFANASILLINLLCCGFFTSPRRRGKWWLRLSIDLAHCGLKEDAFKVCEVALSEPGANFMSPGERMALKRRTLRLAKGPLVERLPEGLPQELSWKPPSETIVARPLDHYRQSSRKSVFFCCNGEAGSVEELALSHYASEDGGGWSGIHCESRAWISIFSLVGWTVLYKSAPPGAFAHPYQSAPLDLRSPDCFHEQRKDKISCVLLQLEAGEAPSMIERIWKEFAGREPQVPGAPWSYSLEDLKCIARAAGGRVLGKIFGNLCIDFSGWSSGMPDIFLWRKHPTGSLEGRFVEVKGPRDRLSDQQIAWLRDLDAVGANAVVLRVQEPKEAPSE